ncbi:BnaA06g25570D [Brassica napus]|uniref:BnaA06g25570D protein n=1 Tax=Brassica napus TaxID=3708 RepID=A0A078GRT5_BRANA|nr:BnaA06g25570D [Brassica napus]
MTTARSLGRDPLFLSSSLSKSDRAAAIKIRFADIIVKSSSNKSEAMMTIRREKRLLQERQLEEKAMIEERMKLRQEERLAVLKMEEEEKAMMEERMSQTRGKTCDNQEGRRRRSKIKLYGPCGRSSQTPLIDHSVAVSITNGSDKDMEKDTCNFKSMTYDDPMDFGFGLPENKDKKQNSFKVCSVHSRELHFLFSLYYLAIKLIW